MNTVGKAKNRVLFTLGKGSLWEHYRQVCFVKNKNTGISIFGTWRMNKIMLIMNRELPVTSGNNFIRKKIWAKGMVSSFSMEILNRRKLKLLNKYFNSCLISHGTCGNYFFSSWRFKKNALKLLNQCFLFLANCQKIYKQSILKIFATVRCVCVLCMSMCCHTCLCMHVWWPEGNTSIFLSGLLLYFLRLSQLLNWELANFSRLAGHQTISILFVII